MMFIHHMFLRGVKRMDVKHSIKLVLESIAIVGLKEKQQEAVVAFLSYKDVFVSLPAGYGKSFICGILPILYIADCARYILMHYVILMMLNTVGKSGSIVVCVSPLASLMIDQKTKFTLQGVTTDFVGESQSDTQALLVGVCNWF